MVALRIKSMLLLFVLVVHFGTKPSSAFSHKQDPDANDDASMYGDEAEEDAPIGQTAFGEGVAPKKSMIQSGNETQAAVDSHNAHTAAATAMTAAKVANKVAVHSVKIATHAKSALKRARNALHEARVDTDGLSNEQRESLKTAEAKLKEATKHASYGEIKNAEYAKTSAENEKLQNLKHQMDKVKQEKSDSRELEEMRNEVKNLRKELAKKDIDDPAIEAALKGIENDIDTAETMGDKGQESHDEMKAEIERLRAKIKGMDDKVQIKHEVPNKEQGKANYDMDLKPLSKESTGAAQETQEATPVETKGIDIDTELPYGDLEPFGREDTAQELTESSIKESDEMVDQLERAEVAEEKRAVFRALTRLRGAAITSYDGVARSQTGNIDEYNKIHKWRKSHPIHHLADEESDVTKWAFPDNAD